MATDQDAEGAYVIRPHFEQKFRSAKIKDEIHEVLIDFFGNKDYDPNEVNEWTRVVSQQLKDRIKGLQLDRYKILVQVVIGERRGEGVRMNFRSLWDCDTDNFAEDVYLNNTLFCVAVVFGIFHY